MENLFTYIVVSKITNQSKIISATDKYHAINKGLPFFDNHLLTDLKVLKQLKKVL